jgi:hypothetical protein
MIVETTLYYARPGEAAAVLALRWRGSALRVALGLAPGEIFVRSEGAGPDVRWECRFADREALAADLAARDASPAFAEQRRQMGALVERFERQIYELVSPEASPP